MSSNTITSSPGALKYSRSGSSSRSAPLPVPASSSGPRLASVRALAVFTRFSPSRRARITTPAVRRVKDRGVLQVGQRLLGKAPPGEALALGPVEQALGVAD